MKKALKILVILILLTVIGFVCFNQLYGPYMLRNRGYSEDEIRLIRQYNCASRVLNLADDTLFKYAINRDPGNIPDCGYYDISIADDAEHQYQIIQILKERYREKDIKYMFEHYSLDSLQHLADDDSFSSSLLFSDIMDLDQLIHLKEEGYSDDEIIHLHELLSEDHFRDYSLYGRYHKDLISLLERADTLYSLIPRYIIFSQKYQIPYDKAIEIVNRNDDYIPEEEINYLDFYAEDSKLTEDPHSLTALINKEYHVTADFVPNNLVRTGNGDMMVEEAYKAFQALNNDAQKHGFDAILLTSNYRSYRDQEEVYQIYTKRNGKDVDNFCARPGYSEHQTGLCSDVGGKVTGYWEFSYYTGYQWVLDNCHEYGIIQRFPLGKDYLTGYEFESWHLRYVGKESARIMHENDWVLEEYKILFR